MFDDRTHDDMPPAPTHHLRVTLGDRWKAEAANDGTLLLTDRKTGMIVEVEATTAEDWFVFTAELGLAAQAWTVMERFAEPEPLPLPRVDRDWFNLFVQAQRDGQRIAS